MVDSQGEQGRMIVGSGRSSVVEHRLPKPSAVGSIPIARSKTIAAHNISPSTTITATAAIGTTTLYRATTPAEILSPRKYLEIP